MTYQQAQVVEVRAWGRRVGAVALDDATGFYIFEYDPDWIKRGIDLAPLSMPNSPELYSFPRLRPQTFQRLAPMLADCLPDFFGNALVNSFLEREGLRAEQITPLDRLGYMGSRGMGALTFHPATFGDGAVASILALSDIVDAAKKVLNGTLTGEQMDQDALSQLIQVGTSAGGARPKAVLAYNPATKQYRSGQVEAPPGFEYWILKLDGVSKEWQEPYGELSEGTDYCRIEYAYFLMAKQCGITISDCELLPEGPRTHFLTKRFDRTASGDRIHMQTLCAISQLDFNLSGAHSYDQYFQAIRDLGMGQSELAEAFRRMVFNVVACNRDDHTKNFSFLLDEGGQWRLAPAYDLTHAHNSEGPWTSKHQMSVNGKFDGINLQDLKAVGEQQGIYGSHQIISEVFGAIDTWQEFAEIAGVSTFSTRRIADDLSRNRPE